MPISILDQEVQKALNEAKTVKKKTIEVDNQNIEIPSPFPSPQDWRDQWIYFVMVDRFNNPVSNPKYQWDSIVGDFQGGTFEGIRQQLGYLKQLGVGALWFTPVMKNCQFLKGTFHGYGIQDFCNSIRDLPLTQPMQKQSCKRLSMNLMLVVFM